VCSECHHLFGTASMLTETCLANRCSFIYHGLDSLLNLALKALLGCAQQWYRSVPGWILPRFVFSSFDVERMSLKNKTIHSLVCLPEFLRNSDLLDCRAVTSSPIENALKRSGSEISILFLFRRFFFVGRTWFCPFAPWILWGAGKQFCKAEVLVSKEYRCGTHSVKRWPSSTVGWKPGTNSTRF
jgi:hypothetical protein